ncbi:SusC/RagA family TonB-linked outer membrane protein [Ichthyenterobacterium sp. W332]|uniref:SusC/RagA family TonB-linked outer membrane protein n=1 Tax=Microcosmobacter mediterraneus TaxID=3075607 RepID=A0ABU2YMS5_9FLAO|nr:SusC/RagA family TonB-linked outer membrane protein [Ichthyenterobacterium sp. W332]MDT0559095.1 SusC/RagA family TonB-linked outer membrane protein [Ichthyenterobacterium sp. W332]
MKLKLTWLLTLFMAFVMQFSFAQEKTITGTVTTADDGLPLPGANVIVKGTARGAQTDFDGKYSIKASSGEVLVFSYVGMKNVEMTVSASNTIDVSLQTDNTLDEVVVTGYRTQSKVTSSVSSVRVTAETIENRPNASFVQTLSGQVPGLNITTSTGQPGGNSLVQLRGVSSINGNTEPLFIIDGAPVDEDNFRSLNPQDIASIDILKDAGATAIYGNRGANGVIVIKTRQGNFNQGLKINYNGFIAYNTLQDNDYNAMSAQELLTYERTRGNGAGAGNSSGKFNPGAGTPLTDAQIAAAPNFNWTDFFFRTGVTQNHTLSLSSGSENTSQFTSFGFSDTQGILRDSDLKRFNLRSNITGKSSNEKFRYATNLTVNYSKSNEPNSIGSGAINRNYILGAYISVPYITPDDYIDGADLLSPLSFTNTPLFLLDRLNTYTRFEEEVKIVGSANFSYALTDWLTANAVLSADYQSEFLTRAEDPRSFNALLFGGAENPTSGFQQQNTNRAFSYNQVTSLNFNKTFADKHTIDVGLYTEYFKAHFRTFGYFGNGLDPRTFFPGDGSALIPTANGLFVDNPQANILNAGLFSYFGSLEYDYDEKYGFAATLRRDASYRFAGSNRWATFWSVSARWNISNEAFMEGSAFNNLKLRASYGTAGNQDIVGGGLFGGPDLTEDFFATTAGYGNANSIALSQLGNRSLRWETIATTNIGVDFGVWNNRLRGTFEVYERQTTDLFQSTPLSATTGVTSQSANTGELFNRGLDIDIDYDILRPTDPDGLRISVGVVGNYNETELKDLPNTEGEIIGLGRNGGILNEYFTLRYVGVNPANGNLLYLTANGNVTENPDADNDRVWLGKNIIPDWNGSFDVNLDYKGFFLTTQFNYVTGVDRFDNDYGGDLVDQNSVGQFNLSSDLFREWTTPGQVTDIPSPNAANLNSFGNSDRFLRDASFLRLRFASFGYSFPEKYLENTGLTNARVFLNGENLFTWSEWRGFDPETRSNGSRVYPTPRTISVGVELGF